VHSLSTRMAYQVLIPIFVSADHIFIIIIISCNTYKTVSGVNSTLHLCEVREEIKINSAEWIVTWRLKHRTLHGNGLINKRVIDRKQPRTIEKFLESVFSVRSVPRLYNEVSGRVDSQSWVGVGPCGIAGQSPTDEDVSTKKLRNLHCWKPLSGGDW
jgi:hypothetical protein